MKISVIIPVYNVEQYLKKCVDSVLNQSYRDLEVILVNDGSTDNSKMICDDYLNIDDRVKVIHQSNSGVSVARNSGISVASGVYITFLDSDDWLELDMYQVFIDKIIEERQPDLLMCDFVNSFDTERIEIKTELRSGRYDKEDIIRSLYPTLLVTENFGRIPIVSTCVCLFKKKPLDLHFIRFDETLRYSEDYLFMAQVMTKIVSFYYLKDLFFYNYRQYNSSRSKKFQTQWWTTLINLNKKLRSHLSGIMEYNFNRQLDLQMIHSALLVSNGIMESSGLSIFSKYKYLQEILRDDELVKIFSKIDFKSNSIFQRIVLLFFKYRLTLCFMAYHKAVSTLKS